MGQGIPRKTLQKQGIPGKAENSYRSDFCDLQFQRTPWGGGKRRGEENLTNDTPPKKGFWTPFVRYVFPPPSGVSALFFLFKIARQSRPEALLEGSKNFRESAFSGTFSSPHTFLHPPISRPNNLRCIADPQKSLAISETRQSNARLRFKGAMEQRARFAISGCDFRAQNPFFLREFCRFRSVNAEIASNCDCAILVLQH